MVDPLPAVTLGDFTHKFGGSLADRDKVYAVTAAHWSHDWIAIPDPTCGSFRRRPISPTTPGASTNSGPESFRPSSPGPAPTP